MQFVVAYQRGLQSAHVCASVAKIYGKSNKLQKETVREEVTSGCCAVGIVQPCVTAVAILAFGHSSFVIGHWHECECAYVQVCECASVRVCKCAIGHWPLAIVHCPLSIVHWPLAIGHSQSFIGHSSLAIGIYIYGYF